MGDFDFLSRYDDFVLEKYGSNDDVRSLKNRVMILLNENLGKLVLNKTVILNGLLGTVRGQNNEFMFKNDIIKISLSDSNYGITNISPSNIKVERDGEFLINGLVVTLSIQLSDSELKAKRIFDGNNIHSLVSHELMHVVEMCHLVSKNSNGKTIASRCWNFDKEKRKIQNKYDFQVWKDVMYFIYLSNDHEIRAKVESVRDIVSGEKINNPAEALTVIRDCKIYKDAVFLSRLPVDIIIDKMKQTGKYDEMLVDIGNLFNTVYDACINIDDASSIEKEFRKFMKHLMKRNVDMISKLEKVSYLFEIYETGWYPGEYMINYDY